MTDERFDELMRDAAETYHRPPEAPLDEMWLEIAARMRGGAEERRRSRVAERWRAFKPWLALAATLVIGVALGRASMKSTHPPTIAPRANGQVASAAPAITPRIDSALSSPYEAETSKYLGQTTALLIALPSEVKAGRADDQFLARAGDLLTTTRLLLDSPAASDQSMRALFEDLELVLAQVVRLQNNHSRTELDLVNQALEQHDVIPRLRTAAADLSAD
jgi:hypothetical protein